MSQVVGGRRRVRFRRYELDHGREPGMKRSAPLRAGTEIVQVRHGWSASDRRSWMMMMALNRPASQDANVRLILEGSSDTMNVGNYGQLTWSFSRL